MTRRSTAFYEGPGPGPGLTIARQPVSAGGGGRGATDTCRAPHPSPCSLCSHGAATTRAPQNPPSARGNSSSETAHEGGPVQTGEGAGRSHRTKTASCSAVGRARREARGARRTDRQKHTRIHTHLVTAARRWCWVTGRLVWAGAEQLQPRVVPAAPARTKSARRPPPPPLGCPSPRCLGSARLGPAGRAAGGRCVGAPGRIHRPPDFPECRHDVCSTHAPQSSGRPSRRARGDLCRVRRRSTPNADPARPRTSSAARNTLRRHAFEARITTRGQRAKFWPASRPIRGDGADTGY